jgi:hypothetical protein
LFRRREPLHERLAREGGLIPRDPRPPWQETGIHGLQRPREWDATVTGEASGVEGNAARFVALPDGTLLVEEGRDGSLQALAAIAEQRAEPPYRARAARQVDDVWAVQVTRIEVLELPDAPAGRTIELTPEGLVVDGVASSDRVAALEGIADVVRAERLDGDLWEIWAARL